MRLAAERLLSTLILLGGAGQRAAAGPPPQPTPAPAQPKVLFSWAKGERSRFQQPLPCVKVGEGHLAAPPLFPEGLPPKARVASDNQKTLGVLLEDPPRGYRLQLFRRGKLREEFFLASPKNRPFVTHPTLVLGPGGDPVALRDREGFAVYSGGQLVGIFHRAHAAQVLFHRGQVFWCPYPRGNWSASERDQQDPPPLWLRAELDGSHEEVLLRADPKRGMRVFEGVWDASDQALAPVFRREDKVWLVGLFSGEMAEASTSGTVHRRFFLPYALRNEEDDPDVIEKLQEDMKSESFPANGDVRKRELDATRHPPRVLGHLVTPGTRVFSFAASRNGRLLLGTATWEPLGALLEVEDEQHVRCWQFPQGVLNNLGWLSAVVTEEGVWFYEKTWRFVGWPVLEDLWEAAHAQEEPQTRRPSER